MTADYVPVWEDLTATGPAQDRLHAQAREKAWEVFGRRVFVRGVVEVSNHCRENCHYCGMRRDNKSLTRYRAEWEPLHRPSSITDLNLQSGEDPVAVREVVLPLIRALKRETDLGISVCLGTLSTPLYQELQDAGAEIYILKFELADSARYRKLQAPGSLEERLEHIRKLAADGWRVSSGFIAGLPDQTPEELLGNFHLARSLPLSGCSVSPFVVSGDTPLGSAAGAGVELALNSMAMLRRMQPHWVIPAVSALNLAQPGEGYARGLSTGANLCTINLTPDPLRQDYLLYKRDRFIMTEERILKAIATAGLTVSEQSLSEFYRSTPSPAAARLATA